MNEFSTRFHQLLRHMFRIKSTEHQQKTSLFDKRITKKKIEYRKQKHSKNNNTLYINKHTSPKAKIKCLKNYMKQTYFNKNVMPKCNIIKANTLWVNNARVCLSITPTKSC